MKTVITIKQRAPASWPPFILAADCLLRAAVEQCPGRLVPLDPKQLVGSTVPSAASKLEARVEELRLERTGSTDMSFRLRIKTRIRLVRTADGAVLYDQPAEYRSGPCLFGDGQQLYSCPARYRSQSRKFTEWAAHDARLFRAELHKCYHELSAAMVDQVVQRGGVPPARLPQPAFAQGR
jgi:hypothetical protein